MQRVYYTNNDGEYTANPLLTPPIAAHRVPERMQVQVRPLAHEPSSLRSLGG